MTFQSFYDNYHKKNNYYYEVIGINNFTYFYTLQFLHLAVQKVPNFRKRVLDYGCGVGTLSIYLSKFAYSVVGTDVSKRAIKIANRAKEELKINNVDFFVSDSPDKIQGKYDLIICSEVIEHLVDDKKAIHELSKLCKKGGYLVLSTPTDKNVLVNSRYYRNFDKKVGHIRRYSTEDLTLLINGNGFVIEQLRSIESPLRNLLFISKLGYLIKFIKGPLVFIFHKFDEFLVKIFGANNLIILARKT